uniref:Uncharacterized protein LOC105117185 n=1 Tax=Rhizophora mucronata TaxID=61149 RepID=A0A2P2IRU2_RHIMU
MAASEEQRRVMMTAGDSVICPKPRRLGILNPSLKEHIRPLRLPLCHQSEMGDSRDGAELLDMFLTKGGYGVEKSGSHVASSPPFYCGSPPSRASNPVIQDAQFVNEKIAPLSPMPSSPSSVCKGGCVRMTFGHKPAAVRIEGFDCLSRDQRNCSISAMA